MGFFSVPVSLFGMDKPETEPLDILCAKHELYQGATSLPKTRLVAKQGFQSLRWAAQMHDKPQRILVFYFTYSFLPLNGMDNILSVPH